MRVVVAPDSFKGTATAADVAAAVIAGWRTVRPDDDVVAVPMADGGEGTLDAFASAHPDATRVPVVVGGPGGRPVHTHWLRLPDGRAVVELATTSGITLLDRLRPDTAHTNGFGTAVRSALDAGATALVLGIGGSASTDGGIGMLAALGLGLELDGAGVPHTGGALLDHVVAVDTTRLVPLPQDGVVVLTDVTSPLLGPTGAAAVFGPQKGITPGRLAVHETRLAGWAARFPDIDPSTPGAGAAGGTGFGLLAWGARPDADARRDVRAGPDAGVRSDAGGRLDPGVRLDAGVRLEAGATAVAREVGLEDALRGADVVITGEGRFDAQSAVGKAATTVRDIARRSAPSCRVLLVAGAVEAEPIGYADSAALVALATQETGDPAAALRDPLHHLRSAGALLARRVLA